MSNTSNKKYNRFYKKVSLGEKEGFYHLLLDDKQAKTPKKNILKLKFRNAAALLKVEWEEQRVFINPDHMPITRLINTSIDWVSDKSNEVKEEIAKYASSDLLFFHAEHPEQLIEKQNKLWKPILSWAELKFSCQFKTSQNLINIEQSQNTINSIKAEIYKLDDPLIISIFSTLVSISGSLILTLAVKYNHITSENAFDLSELEADFTTEIWGKDEEAYQRREARKKEFCSCARLLHACN